MTRQRLCELENSIFEIKGYYSEILKDYDMDFTKHPTFEVMYITAGNCTIRFLSETNPGDIKQFVLQKNNFVFIDALTVHNMSVSDDCQIHHVEFLQKDAGLFPFQSRHFFKNNPAVNEIFKNEFGYIVSSGQAVLDSIKAIHALEGRKSSMLSGEASYVTNLQLLLFELFISIAECALCDRNKRNYGAIHVNKAIRYINSHFKDSNLSITEVAQALCLNKTYLQKMFKRVMDVTIYTYINQLRINEARQILEQTDTSLIDIAVAIGFNNRQNFYSVFKKYTGLSPDQFRKKMQKTNKRTFSNDYVSEKVNEINNPE